jgi:acyl transferase domain-containing protein
MQGWPIAIVFPGQGALDIRTVEAYQRTDPELFPSAAGPDDATGPRSRGALIETLCGSGAPSGRLQLRIYGASVAAFQRLTRQGVAPRALVGHGFGEIAALVAAGGFTVAEGADLVAARHVALSGSNRRYALASIQASSSKVALFIELLQDAQVSVAVENSSRHTVIVGPERAITGAAQLARQLGLVFKRLKTIGAPHGAHVKAVAAQMIARLQHITPRSLRIPVYSPLRRRFFVDGDDLVGCVAEQLVEPLRFADAVRQLTTDDVWLFVECGPLRGLASTLDCASIADTDFDRTLAAKRHAGGVRVFPPAYAESEVA